MLLGADPLTRMEQAQADANDLLAEYNLLYVAE